MKYKGMTVNERLYLSNLIDEFENAIKERDANKIREILKQVELEDESINPILEKYGL